MQGLQLMWVSGLECGVSASKRSREGASLVPSTSKRALKQRAVKRETWQQPKRYEACVELLLFEIQSVRARLLVLSFARVRFLA